MDKFGKVAASSSSGGIILKQDGRVGQVNILYVYINYRIFDWYTVCKY